jgi:hypothetical protein
MDIGKLQHFWQQCDDDTLRSGFEFERPRAAPTEWRVRCKPGTTELVAGLHCGPGLEPGLS